MKKCFIFVGWILALSLLGCEHARLSIGGNPTTPYHKELAKQTRAKKLYGLEEVLYETDITYFSDQLRDRYIDEYLRVFAPEEPDRNKFITQQKEDQKEYTEFIVCHFTSSIDSTDLKSAESSKVWDFFLFPDGEGKGIRPLSIDIIKKSTRSEYFYPQATAWSKIYKLRFPRVRAQSFTLEMFGPVRNIDFQWKNIGA
ncbi:MAG: hypothetical protein KDD52_02485 [Bdellovibrionales bacterium]|nr:hypothetical protein [Bdellovibrionales bacterium]